MSTYPHERKIEYWVSRAIEDYFDNQGYDIVVLPNTQTAEKQIPYDHLFAGKGIKVFGLQYKRLENGPKDYWSIDVTQLNRLINFTWIYYALPEITSISQHRNALHLLALTSSASIINNITIKATSDFRLLRSQLGVGSNKVPYYRWGGFVQSLLACKIGWSPSNSDDLRRIFRESVDIADTLTDIYIIPLDIQESRLALRVSPFVSDIQDSQYGYDFGFNAEDQG